MKNRLTRFTAVFLSVLFLLGSTPVRTQSLTELQKKQNEANAKKNAALAALSDAKDQKNDLLIELIEMDINVEALGEELDFITAELERTTEALEKAEIDLAEATVTKEQQQEALVKRLRVMDENGVMTYVQILFDSKDLLDFLDKLENVKTIAEFDKSLYAQLEATELKINTSVDEISQKKRETELLLSQQQNKKTALEETIEAKNLRVVALEADELSFQKLAADSEASSNEVGILIRQKQADAAKAAAAKAQTSKTSTVSVNYSGGKLAWCVPGVYKKSSGYGYRSDPFTKRQDFHTGLDIPAPRGTPIVAAEAGVVIFASWKNGYGNCVIIDHGGNLSTLYGHCSSLTVSVGESVTRGETIAKVGSTGRSTGNHCHFEVRIDGEHTNPNSYLN